MKSIKQIAEDFDLAIEQRNILRILEFFSEDCEIELLGVHLNGKEGAVKWINWLFANAPDLKFELVNIYSTQ